MFLIFPIIILNDTCIKCYQWQKRQYQKISISNITKLLIKKIYESCYKNWQCIRMSARSAFRI